MRFQPEIQILFMTRSKLNKFSQQSEKHLGQESEFRIFVSCQDFCLESWSRYFSLCVEFFFFFDLHLKRISLSVLLNKFEIEKK